MTIARSIKVDLSVTPYYHCLARCVRRTYLCGQDIETGKDFSHRKQWIVGRLKQLVSLFAIKVCAYAIMNNHYHLVLYINESKARAWQDKDIFERWEALFPNDIRQFMNKMPNNTEIQSKLLIWRERLISLSWFMKCLNEPIARSSNLEDDCTGRFWEGRFKSQALLDEGAVLSAMAYVDLNPIRAQIANTPESSEFTSIYERIQVLAKNLKKKPFQNIENVKQPKKLMPFHSANEKEATINFKLSDYLKLVDTTGRIILQNKRGAIPEDLTPILFRLRLTPNGWLEMVKGLEKGFFYAIGHEARLRSFGIRYTNRVPKGVTKAKCCYLKTA
ncbi:MAG: transposase [Proteobacteria bacterium]|nr:transposase [Pseudomonadota bacterium]